MPRHAAVIRGGGLEVTVVPSLACLCASLIHGGDELLWRRADLDGYAHGALTGVSLLHPWAGRLAGERVAVAGGELGLGPEAPVVARDANGLALHGVQAGDLPFSVTGAGDAWLSATLDALRAPALLELFPFEHRLDVTLSLDDDGLTLETALTAGPEPVPVAYGYHPFFALPAGSRADCALELPLTHRVPLDERLLPGGPDVSAEGAGGLLGERRFDDLFRGPIGPLALESAERRIELRLLEGYDYVHVWAPPDHDAIAFEPMTAPTDALNSGRDLHVLGPGERYRASFRISIS